MLSSDLGSAAGKAGSLTSGTTGAWTVTLSTVALLDLAAGCCTDVCRDSVVATAASGAAAEGALGAAAGVDSLFGADRGRAMSMAPLGSVLTVSAVPSSSFVTASCGENAPDTPCVLKPSSCS